MHSNGQGLAAFAAAQAVLARFGRVHFHHSSPSFCRFDAECLQEATPTRIVDLLGKHASGHAADVQLFDGDQLVAVDDLAGELACIVRSLIGDMLVDALELADGLASAIRPLDAMRHLALCPPQAPLGPLVPAGVGNEVSVAEGGEVFQAHVDADFIMHDGQRLGLVLDAEADVPGVIARFVSRIYVRQERGARAQPSYNVAVLECQIEGNYNFYLTRQVCPIYDDPWFGPYKGEAVDRVDLPLTRQVVRGMVMDILATQAGDTRDLESELVNSLSEDDIADFVRMQCVNGGNESVLFDGPFASVEDPLFREYLRNILDDLGEKGFVQEVETGFWLLRFHPAYIPTYEQLRELREDEAEIPLGNGRYSVYGWYLLAYRELADLRGEDRFPMKVGTTHTEPWKRAKRHIGTAPEHPIMGFLLKTNRKDAEIVEGWLHSELKLRNRHIPQAFGIEWFMTSPEELRDIVLPRLGELEGDLDA